jgi:Gluconate 2-dehydrogenase subunit 3
MVFRRGTESQGIVPGGKQERFPGYDVLGEVPTWDAVTTGVVLARLGRPVDLRFFTVEEEAIGHCLFNQLLDQREPPYVPILEMVDGRLAEQQTDGWHYADMPEDGEAFRRSFAALDADARSRFARAFAALSWDEQADLVQHVQDTDGDWHGLPATRVWSLWTRYGCSAFYSHPYAWNEIGFGGPAYPRGYKNIGLDKREPWEVSDHVNRDPTRTAPPVEQAPGRPDGGDASPGGHETPQGVPGGSR